MHHQIPGCKKPLLTTFPFFLTFQLEQVLDNPRQFKLRVEEPELQGLVENLHYSSEVLQANLVEAVLYFLCALEGKAYLF